MCWLWWGKSDVTARWGVVHFFFVFFFHVSDHYSFSQSNYWNWVLEENHYIYLSLETMFPHDNTYMCTMQKKSYIKSLQFKMGISKPLANWAFLVTVNACVSHISHTRVDSHRNSSSYRYTRKLLDGRLSWAWFVVGICVYPNRTEIFRRECSMQRALNAWRMRPMRDQAPFQENQSAYFLFAATGCGAAIFN